jgi:hypothetical protein
MRVSDRWIREVPPHDDDYWVHVRAIAKEMKSDGCTLVRDFHKDSCLEHDIHWRTGETIFGATITTKQANERFRRVIQSRSPLGRFSPMSWVRFAGVLIGAHFIDHKSE